jgi:glycosyltransferase involved in cell wall biosynthesis
LAACEFLCLPSNQESFGGVYVEAWAQRKAVIGGRTSQIASVIDEGENGLLASQDPDDLAVAMYRLLDDPIACSAMGSAGWLKTQQRYAWEQLAAKTLEVYRAVGARELPAECQPSIQALPDSTSMPLLAGGVPL